jgi:hypothetical protein
MTKAKATVRRARPASDIRDERRWAIEKAIEARNVYGQPGTIVEAAGQFLDFLDTGKAPPRQERVSRLDDPNRIEAWGSGPGGTIKTSLYADASRAVEPNGMDDPINPVVMLPINPVVMPPKIKRKRNRSAKAIAESARKTRPSTYRRLKRRQK